MVSSEITSERCSISIGNEEITSNILDTTSATISNSNAIITVLAGDNEDAGGPSSVSGSTSTGCRSQSGPPSLSTTYDDAELRNSLKNRPLNNLVGSPTLKVSSEYGEESYEGLGYGRGDVELGDVEVESPGDGSSSAPSPTAGLNSLG